MCLLESNGRWIEFWKDGDNKLFLTVRRWKGERVLDMHIEECYENEIRCIF